MLTNTQIKIMKIFISAITERFSIKQISEIANSFYPLIHRSMAVLLKEGFLVKDKQGFLSLNYKENNPYLAYFESLRADEFLKKNKTIALFANSVLKKIDEDFFILLIFGSSALGKKNANDIDILYITDNKNKVNEADKILRNISSNFTLKFDISIISRQSAYEMLSKRDSINIMNETLKNHILIFRAGNYYRMLKNAR